MTSVPLATGRPDFPAGTGTADLLGYGRISWDQLTAMLAGAQAAWADYAGFHVGPAPAEPPPYFHLWAWTPQWLARARIELGTAITGVLALHGERRAGPGHVVQGNRRLPADSGTDLATRRQARRPATRSHRRPAHGYLPDRRGSPDHLRRRPDGQRRDGRRPGSGLRVTGWLVIMKKGCHLRKPATSVNSQFASFVQGAARILPKGCVQSDIIVAGHRHA